MKEYRYHELFHNEIQEYRHNYKYKQIHYRTTNSSSDSAFSVDRINSITFRNTNAISVSKTCNTEPMLKGFSIEGSTACQSVITYGFAIHIIIIIFICSDKNT